MMTYAEITERAERWVQALNENHECTTGNGARFALVPNPSRRGKYSRIVRTRPDGVTAEHVHAFVELSTGAVLKAAGWKAPAPGIRYQLTDEDSFALLLERAAGRLAFTGDYLYMS